MPIAIITLLFASSSAGWYLYYGNVQSLEAVELEKQRLTAQLTAQVELQATISAQGT